MDERRTILVVGGDEFIRQAIVKYCSGYAPTVSVSTIEAAMRALAEDVVAVILDIHPQDDIGLDLPEKIRQRKPLLSIAPSYSVNPIVPNALKILSRGPSAPIVHHSLACR
jgi:DNA-binding NtrC family response regulator